jgi:hypothetical protein
MKRVLTIAVALLCFACGGKSSLSGPTTRSISLIGNLGLGTVQIGQNASATLTVRNTGTGTLTISGVVASNAIASVLTVDWTSATIAAGSSKDLRITFWPTAAQTYSGSITLTGDMTSGTNTSAFSGTGTFDGVALFTASGVGSGVVTVPAYVTQLRATVSYSGCQAFTVSTSSGGTTINAYYIVGTTCSLSDSRRLVTGGILDVGDGQKQMSITGPGVSWTFTEVRQ